MKYLMTYLFPLRPDLNVSLELPRDLTCEEAARIVAFIKSLIMKKETDTK